MRPGDRVDLISRCGKTLGARSWADIDFILGQFGIPTQDMWDDPTEDSRYNYVRQMLGRDYNDDRSLLALDDYLHAVPTHHETDEPWDIRAVCKVFISHLASQWATANAVKVGLEWWGLDAFVAHKDIEPGAEWVRVISAAMHSCDALVALLHDGFKESNWCDQEVGFAFGRAVPVLPVKIDMAPYGFLGTFQAVTWSGSLAVDGVVVDVVRILLGDKRTSDRVVEAIVQKLESANSYKQANDLSTFLAGSSAPITIDQVSRIRAAQKDNRQVGEAHSVEAAISTLEARVPQQSKPPSPQTPLVAPAPVAATADPFTYDYGDEPF